MCVAQYACLTYRRVTRKGRAGDFAALPASESANASPEAEVESPQTGDDTRDTSTRKSECGSFDSGYHASASPSSLSRTSADSRTLRLAARDSKMHALPEDESLSTASATLHPPKRTLPSRLGSSDSRLSSATSHKSSVTEGPNDDDDQSDLEAELYNKCLESRSPDGVFDDSALSESTLPDSLFSVDIARMKSMRLFIEGDRAAMVPEATSSPIGSDAFMGLGIIDGDSVFADSSLLPPRSDMEPSPVATGGQAVITQPCAAETMSSKSAESSPSAADCPHSPEQNSKEGLSPLNEAQLVVASTENQYKVFHFHSGGLQKLADLFTSPQMAAFLREDINPHQVSYFWEFKSNKICGLTFNVLRRESIDYDLLDPEEGAFSQVDAERWSSLVSSDGRITNPHQLKKEIFFGGLDPAIRHDVWPFLLHYYDFRSTFDERYHFKNDKYLAYEAIRSKRERMTDEEKEMFWRRVGNVVEKDVIRTDRMTPYFTGDLNPHLDILKNILLNYAAGHPESGYSQGMSDLLAPLLAYIRAESDTYWCFDGLMQRTLFFSSPKDDDMDLQLGYLRELTRVLLPDFYVYLKKVDQELDLLFCHRWLLLCFKREFPDEAGLQVWEACWAHYRTDYFQLFVAIAIFSVYGQNAMREALPSDQVLLHFQQLSGRMNVELVLKQARGYLHRFRSLSVIPCTLSDLCYFCGPGQWDSRYVPKVRCTEQHKGSCKYLIPDRGDSFNRSKSLVEGTS